MMSLAGKPFRVGREGAVEVQGVARKEEQVNLAVLIKIGFKDEPDA